MTEWVGIKWLMNETTIKSHATLKKKILIPFREELESFVQYPNNPGEPWLFARVYMKDWLQNNAGRINNENHTRRTISNQH